MSRRSLKERHIRKITKIGGRSYAVTLPIEIIHQLSWRERQKVVVEVEQGKVVIRDWKKP